MIRRVLLVPGFCEPRWLLWPVGRALRNSGRSVEMWHDRMVCRSLDQSIDLLRRELEKAIHDDASLAIVTHSFGDWMVRQAIAQSSRSTVAALVSLTPVIGPSPFAKVLKCLGGGCVSEIAVMTDSIRAGEHANLNSSIRRMVVWAAIDLWVRAIEFENVENIEVRRCLATHLSIALQPNIHQQINQFLDRELPAE